MPIPQFHRTPKMRRRRTRPSALTQERFGAPQSDTTFASESDMAPRQNADADENCALLQPGDSDDSPLPMSEEVPALLSWWPPRRTK